MKFMSIRAGLRNPTARDPIDGGKKDHVVHGRSPLRSAEFVRRLYRAAVVPRP